MRESTWSRVIEYNSDGIETKIYSSKGIEKKNSDFTHSEGYAIVFRNAFQDMFLPIGYPNSVSEDYSSFQCYDTIQAMCSYLRSILATQSLLKGLGVGESNADSASAALLWVFKDLTSMLGGLMFSYWGGARFDYNIKVWRLFADIINDLGLTLDMIIPLLPQSMFSFVLCIATLCKSLCGVAAGATRASLTSHFAVNGNISDVASKEGAQETFVTLIGLISGLIFAKALNHSPSTIWFSFVILTVIHVYTNYLAVTSLVLRQFNLSRIVIFTDHIISSSDKHNQTAINHNSSICFNNNSNNDNNKNDDEHRYSLPRPLDISQMESVLIKLPFLRHLISTSTNIHNRNNHMGFSESCVVIGGSMAQLSGGNHSYFQWLIEQYQRRNYMVSWNFKSQQCIVGLTPDATVGMDVFQACVLSFLLSRNILSNSNYSRGNNMEEQWLTTTVRSNFRDVDLFQELRCNISQTLKQFDTLSKRYQLNSQKTFTNLGWNVNKVLISDSHIRIQWNHDKTSNNMNKKTI